MSKIIIDAGHTTHIDPGAVANNTTEHTEVKIIANDVVSKLRAAQEFSNYEIVMIPTDKTLIQKIQYANSIAGAQDYLISIHLNAAGNVLATGTETYYLGGVEARRQQAVLFNNAAVGVLGLRDRGVGADTSTRHGRLGIIRDVKAQSYLIEVGFITNLSDLTRLRQVGADAIVAGLRAMLALRSSSNSPVTLPVTPSSPSTIKTIEAQIDQVIVRGKQLDQWEKELLQKRQAWDLDLDRLRGLLLAEIEKKRTELDPLFVDIETRDMRALALTNNELIGLFAQMVEKRTVWSSNVDALRKALKNYLPNS